MKLYFDVNKNVLTRRNSEIITSFSHNTNKCYFHCKKQWAHIYKYALFTDVNDKEYIIDLGIGSIVKCYIPDAVLKDNYFSLSVFGSNRYTTTQQTILVQPSGFSDRIEDDFEDDLVLDLDYDYGSLLWDRLLLKYGRNCDNNQDNSDLSTVARTGSFNDLKDIPTEFTPSKHEHTTHDITDLDDDIDLDFDYLIEELMK